MIWALLLVAVVLVAAAAVGVFLAVQRPDFLIGLGTAIGKRLLAAILKLPSWKEIKARHTPEEWKRIRDDAERERRGGNK